MHNENLILINIHSNFHQKYRRDGKHCKASTQASKYIRLTRSTKQPHPHSLVSIVGSLEPEDYSNRLMCYLGASGPWFWDSPNASIVAIQKKKGFDKSLFA